MRSTLRYYLFACFLITSVQGQNKKVLIHTIAFYNFENLFDIIDDPLTNDDEWTPKGKQRWTANKYQQKLKNLARVISDIGTTENPNAPTIIGCSEIENRSVLEDLIKQPSLLQYDFGIIHFDSPDKRGIDVGLLYQKKYFSPTSISSIPLIIYKKQNTNSTKNQDSTSSVQLSKYRIFTRDQLLVTGNLEGEEVHFIVNHWPSRSGGEKISSPYRIAAAALNKRIIDSLQQIDPAAKVFSMGDFNDGPSKKSIKETLGAKALKNELSSLDLYNPFAEMARKGMGTLAHRDAWDIFDQIIISQPLVFSDPKMLHYWKSGIFNKFYLIQTSGQYKGYPLRHSQNEVGYSDHFPVYMYVIKEVN